MLSFTGSAAVVNDAHLRMCATFDKPFDCTVEYYPAVSAFSVFKGANLPSRFARSPDGSVVDGSSSVRKARLSALVCQVHANDVINIATTPAPSSDVGSTFAEDALESITITYRPAKEKKAAFARLLLTVDAANPKHTASGGDHRPLSMVLPGQDPDDVDAPPATACAKQAHSAFTFPGRQLAKLEADLRKAAFPFGPLHFTVIVSPVSGKGEGMKQWMTHGQPLIDASPHTCKVVLTTRRGHAEEMAEKDALKPNEVLVAVGGDGMAHEIVNGYRRRLVAQRNAADAADAASVSVSSSSSLPRVALFPTGSGCALAKTLGIIEVRDAAMALVHANHLPIDLMDIAFTPVSKLVKPTGKGAKKSDPRVEAPAEELVAQHRSAFLSVTFAFGAAVDIESEVYRWMGNARFTVYAIKKMMPGVPSYPMRIRYKPLRSSDVPAAFRVVGGAAATSPVPLDSTGVVSANVQPFTVRNDVAAAAAAGSTEPIAAAPAAANTEEWVTLEQEEHVFVLFANIPWIARDMMAAPFCHMNDGAMDLVYAAPGINRKDLVGAMIDMEEGKHVAHPKIRYIKCTAIEVIPRDGLCSVDGEHFPLAQVNATMSKERLPIVHQALKPTPEEFEKAVLAAASVPPV